MKSVKSLINGLFVIMFLSIAYHYFVISPKIDSLNIELSDLLVKTKELDKIDDIIIREDGNTVLFWDENGDLEEGLLMLENISKVMPEIKIQSVKKKETNK